MAKLIPSGVIQLPNFAELQYKLNEREREKQLQFDEFSSQFARKAGTYLDGDREAVQTAYSGVESALKELARDPDNIDLRRKLREANAGYNEVAGSAQFAAQNLREQQSAYYANPDNFTFGEDNAMDVFNRERTTKRDANQIMSLASNPFTLQTKYKYDMESPTALSKRAEEVFRKNINDYIRKDGSIDMDKAREFINNFTNSHYADPNQVKNAIIYEGVSQGMIGRNNEITSRADLDIIDTEAFAPQKDILAGQFKNKSIDAFLDRIPKMGVNQFELDQKRQEMELRRQAAAAKGNEFPRMQIRQAPENGSIPVKYIPAAKTDKNGIPISSTGARQAEFTSQAVIDIPSGSSPTYLDPSTGDEYKIRKVMYDLEGQPYFLRSFKQDDGLGTEKDVFDVQMVNSEVLGSFSKADREFLTYVIGGAETTDNQDPLGVL
jgi:hypothetical protein